MIKILVVSNYNEFHSVRPEAEIFISLAKRGHNITIMTFGGSRYADLFSLNNIRVIDHHPNKKYQPGSIKIIRQELVKGQYEFLHLYNNKSLTNGLRAAKGLPVKVIGYRGSDLNFAWFNPFNYFKHLSPRLDKVICNSIGVALRYRSHPFFDGKKAVVINKGHNLMWYENVKSVNIRQIHNLNSEQVIFILVANDRTMKGVKYLLEGVNLLPPKSNFCLFLIGNGMDTKKYKKIISSGPHRDKIFALGFNSEALSYVAGSDVFVLPSIKGESITKAVLEAMSLGKCPLITDIPGNKELVEHQKNGLVVSSKSGKSISKAMLHLIQNPKEIKKWGKASQDLIRTSLSHQKTVGEYEELYQKLIN